MKILKYLKNGFWKITRNNSLTYYSTIDDFPLYNWEKCQQDNYRYVNVDGKARSNDAYRWANLYNEYLQRFGIGDEMDRYLEAKKQLTNLRIQYIMTSDRMLLNYIAIEEDNLKILDPSKHQGLSIDQCLIHLNKWMGQWLDKKKITIVDFKNLLREYGSNQEK
jgi:hypothetical protein